MIAITGSGEIAQNLAKSLIKKNKEFKLYGRSDITNREIRKFYSRLENYENLEFQENIESLVITNGNFLMCNFTDYEQNDIRMLIESNFAIVAVIIWKFLRVSKNGSSRNIFVLGSTAAIDQSAQTSLYSASKLAVNGLLKVLNKEFAKQDTRFSYISFSTVKNTMGSKVPDQISETLLDLDQLTEEILFRVLRDKNYFEPEIVIRRRFIQEHPLK